MRALSDTIDAAVQSVCGHLAEQDIAVIATGGYGRHTMHPHSDIDVLFIYQHSKDDIEPCVQALWQLGYSIGHRCVAANDLPEVIAGDVVFATALLDARVLVGKPSWFATITKALTAHWPIAVFLQAKHHEQQQRHNRFDNVSYSLEPNIKNSPGGIRDAYMVLWLLQVQRLGDTKAPPLISDYARHTLNDALWQMHNLRFALHTIQNKTGEDRLYFAHQQTLADSLKIAPSNQLNIEVLMQGYYRHALAITAINANAFQAGFERYGKARTHQRQVLDIVYYRVDSTLYITNTSYLRVEPHQIMVAFWHLATNPTLRYISSHLADGLYQHRNYLTARVRNDAAVQRLMVDILRRSTNLFHDLGLMSRYGILGRYLPAFARITGQMQHDLFHIYTVDAHTLMLLRYLQEMLIVKNRNPQLSLVAHVAQEIRHYDLLLVAGLFHDIAKGRGGDHSQLGGVEVEKFAQAHGYSTKHCQLLRWLVEQHLLFSFTAQHEDIADPATIQRFIHRVGTFTRLRYLYVLTVADINATNPTLWDSWKTTLFDQLYQQAKTYLLERDAQNVQLAVERRQQAILKHYQPDQKQAIQAMWQGLDDEFFLLPSKATLRAHIDAIVADDGVTVHCSPTHANALGATNIFVHCHDQPALLQCLVAALDGLFVQIQDAAIFTSEQGKVFDTFVVLDTDLTPVAEEKYPHIVAHVRDAMTKIQTVRPATNRRLPQADTFFWSQPRVRWQHHAMHSMLRVSCSNRPGVLFGIVSALAQHGVTVQRARIASFGDKAEDVLRVCHHNGCVPAGISEHIGDGIVERIEQLRHIGS